MHNIINVVPHMFCKEKQLNSSLDMLTKVLLIMERTLMAVATALEQCKDGLRSLQIQTPRSFSWSTLVNSTYSPDSSCKTYSAPDVSLTFQ